MSHLTLRACFKMYACSSGVPALCAFVRGLSLMSVACTLWMQSRADAALVEQLAPHFRSLQLCNLESARKLTSKQPDFTIGFEQFSVSRLAACAVFFLRSKHSRSAQQFKPNSRLAPSINAVAIHSIWLPQTGVLSLTARAQLARHPVMPPSTAPRCSSAATQTISYQLCPNT